MEKNAYFIVTSDLMPYLHAIGQNTWLINVNDII